jgi:hypothetical protein
MNQSDTRRGTRKDGQFFNPFYIVASGDSINPKVPGCAVNPEIRNLLCLWSELNKLLSRILAYRLGITG